MDQTAYAARVHFVERDYAFGVVQEQQARTRA
jgi:hypothetical protein